MMLTMLVTRVVKYDVNYVIDVNYGTLNDGMRICWISSTSRHRR